MAAQGQITRNSRHTPGENAVPARHTFAVGLFSAVQALSAAINDLVLNGIAGARISLVACEDALHQQYLPALERVSAAEAIGHIAARSHEASTSFVYEILSWSTAAATDGAGGPRQLGLAHARNFHHWTLERHACKLHRHLRAGGGILLIRLADDQEQRDVCSILLDYADHGVQTHEIRHRG